MLTAQSQVTITEICWKCGHAGHEPDGDCHGLATSSLFASWHELCGADASP